MTFQVAVGQAYSTSFTCHLRCFFEKWMSFDIPLILKPGLVKWMTSDICLKDYSITSHLEQPFTTSTSLLNHHWTQEGVEEVIATIAPFLSVSGGSIELIERLSEEIHRNLTGSTPPQCHCPGNSALIRGSWWLI